MPQRPAGGGALPQKWFAAAKEAHLFDEAIALAKQTPCDPRTLTRAARDFAEKNPTFATQAGMAAFYWLIRGHGYEITSADVWAAWSTTMRAARNAGEGDEVRARICSACGRRAAAQRLRRRDCHALRRARIRNEVFAGQANIQPAVLSTRGSWIASTAATRPLPSADPLGALDGVEQLLLLGAELHRRSPP